MAFSKKALARISLAFCLMLSLPAGAQTGDASAAVPPHLFIARDLVDHIKPEDNHYLLGGRAISLPGDGVSSGYGMTADCSGFLLALFERAHYRTESQMVFLVNGKRRMRLVAEDFVLSIERGKGFQRIQTVDAMLPGDLLAHAMLSKEDQKQTSTTGHVFLINSLPKPIAPKRPIVEGTRQYEVSIIDSNEEHVGSDDTRLANSASPITGLGRGTIRLYSDANGALVGWARTFPHATRFFSYSPDFPSDTKLRKAAIGRPLVGG